MEELTEQKCVACRVGAPSVTPDEITQLHPKIPDWQIITEDGIPKLDRVFKFKNFKDAIAFTDAVGAAAEEEGHHLRITTEWGKSPSPGGRIRFATCTRTTSSWRRRPTRSTRSFRRRSVEAQ